MANNSNKKLSIWRKQCRDALVAHIHDRLHVEVDPALVRLQPSPEDQYAWSITESKAFLLKSPLSTHSVKNLQLICREIGSSIEAIAPTDKLQLRAEAGHPTRDTQLPSKYEYQNGSFSARICDLESTNRELREELDAMRTTVEKVAIEKDDLESRVRDLESELERIRSQNHSMKGDFSRTADILSNALQLVRTHQEDGEGLSSPRAPK